MKIIKFGTISEDENGNLVLTGTHIDGEGKIPTLEDIVQALIDRMKTELVTGNGSDKAYFGEVGMVDYDKARDCEHGRQIGKCGDCEYQDLLGELSDIRADRDALKAENESLHAKNASLKAEIDYPESVLLEEPFCWFMWNPNEPEGLNEGFVQFCEQNPASEKPDWKGHVWKAIKLYASPVPAQQLTDDARYIIDPRLNDDGEYYILGKDINAILKGGENER